jgi:hypothetical protein
LHVLACAPEFRRQAIVFKVFVAILSLNGDLLALVADESLTLLSLLIDCRC